jgi:hypothetical protein
MVAALLVLLLMMNCLLPKDPKDGVLLRSLSLSLFGKTPLLRCQQEQQPPTTAQLSANEKLSKKKIRLSTIIVSSWTKFSDRGVRFRVNLGRLGSPKKTH